MKLIWWKFKRHRVALVVGAVSSGVLYAMLPFVEVIAPYRADASATATSSPRRRRACISSTRAALSGPSSIPTASVRPRDASSGPMSSTARSRSRCASSAPASPTISGASSPADFHLVCPPENGTFFLLGTDRLGRDLLLAHHLRRADLADGRPDRHRRLFIIGLTLGGLAGYVGGWVDSVVLRAIEILRSCRSCRSGWRLSAALPANWSPILVFFGITLILGLLDWPGLALAVRSKLLSLREEDFVHAAELMGASRGAHHRAPPHPELHEPSDRQRDALDSRDDPGRDRALVPRAWGCARR